MTLPPRGSPPPSRRMAGACGEGVKPDTYYRERRTPVSTESGIPLPHGLVSDRATPADRARPPTKSGPPQGFANNR